MDIYKWYKKDIHKKLKCEIGKISINKITHFSKNVYIPIISIKYIIPMHDWVPVIKYYKYKKGKKKILYGKFLKKYSGYTKYQINKKYGKYQKCRKYMYFHRLLWKSTSFSSL